MPSNNNDCGSGTADDDGGGSFLGVEMNPNKATGVPVDGPEVL